MTKDEATPPVECELKLVGTRGALRSAEAAIAKFIGTGVDWQTMELQTSYFDTSDRRLSRRGVAVRVRKTEKDYTLTVKAEAEATQALSVRPEWNVKSPTARPDLELLPHDARARVGLVLPGELRNLFTVKVVRKKAVIAIERDGETALVEVAVDRGDVGSGRKKSDITELELELLEGDAAPVYDLAIVLAECGLRTSQLTKAGRGFILLDGAAPVRPVKAPKLSLNRRQTVSSAVSDILSAGLANVLDNEAACLAGTDPEGVHQMRVSLRRMRSLFSVFKRMLDAERCVWAKAELKWLASSLGPARDWDVFADEILRPVAGTGIDSTAVQSLIDGADERRVDGYLQAREAIRSPRYTKLIFGMSQFIETHGWMGDGADERLSQPLGDIAADILQRAFRKLKKRGIGLATMPVADRHEVRIELKKFRYAVDFLNALYPATQVRPFMKALSRMQDQFGHLNDVSVAETLLNDLISVKGLPASERQTRLTGAGQVIGWHARGLHDYEAAFLSDWNTLITSPVFWKKEKGA